MSAARDEANRHMRARAAGAAAGRTCWALADYNVAVETFERLWPTNVKAKGETEMSNTREFHLGDILSITSGYLLSPRKMDGFYDILKFLTGDSLFTHQLGRAMGIAKTYLLSSYPELVIHTGMTHEAKRSLGDSWGAILNPPNGIPQCQAWLIGYCSQIGRSHFALTPMPEGTWLSIDPMKELASMIGEDRIIAIEIE